MRSSVILAWPRPCFHLCAASPGMVGLQHAQASFDPSACPMWICDILSVAGKTVSDAEAAEYDQLADAIEMAESTAERVEQLRELAEGRQVPPWRG